MWPPPTAAVEVYRTGNETATGGDRKPGRIAEREVRKGWTKEE